MKVIDRYTVSMLFLSQEKLRATIRDEIRLFMEEAGKTTELDIVNYETGAEIIYPNFIKEQFDSGKVESLKDIL